MKDKTYKFPRTPGGCVDRLYELEQKRAEAQRVVDALKAEYAALETHLLTELPKEELDGAIGKTATAKISRTNVPQVDDWPALYAYIKKTDSWELLQKRVSSTACRDRWEDKKAIPGVSAFLRISLSLTKR